jgi:hypothetical protein
MYNRASPETAAMMTRARDPFGHKAIKEWCYEADFAETELIGKWEIVDGQVQADATYERIEWLTTNCLEKIAASDGGWDAHSETLAMVVSGNEPILRVKSKEAVRPG